MLQGARRSNPQGMTSLPDLRPLGMDPPSTFVEIYRRHHHRVLRSIQRFGVPSRYVEDVAQDAFLAVQGALPRRDPDRPLKPWLKVIVYRTARDFLRRHQNRHEWVRDPGKIDRVEPQGPDSQEQRAAVHDALAFLEEALSRMDDACREVFLMHEIDEIEMPDIAVALEVHKSTVISRLRRARHEIEQLKGRRRAEEERRHGSAKLLPLFLIDGRALLDAGRDLPKLSLGAADRAWERLVRATPSSGASGVQALLAALTPQQIAASLVLALAIGAGIGGAGAYAWLRPARQPPALAVVSEGGPALGAAGSAAPSSSERVEVFRAPGSESAEGPPPGEPQKTPVSATSGELRRGERPKPPPAASTDGARRAEIATDAGPSVAAADQEEIDALSRAQSALRQYRPEAALGELDRHAQRYPKSDFKEERDSLRRKALAQLRARSGGAP